MLITVKSYVPHIVKFLLSFALPPAPAILLLSSCFCIFASDILYPFSFTLFPYFAMAKSRSFFGIRRGRVGNLVFTRGLNGQQITREAPSQVTNPQTARQQVQRMAFAAISSVRKRFADIVDHSFEGEKFKQGSLSRFTQENLRMQVNRSYFADGDPDGLFLATTFAKDGVDITDMNYNAVYYAPYIMSMGSLAPLRHRVLNQSVTSDRQIFGVTLGINEAFDFLPADRVPLTWVEWFRMNDIQVGDVITIVVGDMRLQRPCGWVRFTCYAYPEGNAGSAVTGEIAHYFTVTTGGLYYEMDYGFFSLYDSPNMRQLGVRIQGIERIYDLVPQLCYFVVKSRQREDGVWLRSTQTLDYVDGDMSTYITDASTLTAMWDSWRVGPSRILNGPNSIVAGSDVVPPYTPSPAPRPVPPTPETSDLSASGASVLNADLKSKSKSKSKDQ